MLGYQILKKYESLRIIRIRKFAKVRTSKPSTNNNKNAKTYFGNTILLITIETPKPREAEKFTFLKQQNCIKLQRNKKKQFFFTN